MPGATLARLACCRFDRPRERVHDSPDGAEQADVRADRADRGQEVQPRFQPVHLTLVRGAHGAPCAVERRLRVAAAAQLQEFAHAGFEDALLHAGLAARIRGLLVELLQFGAAPELPLELLGLALGPLDRETLLEDRRPRSDRQQREQQHHELHDDGRLGDQREYREVASGIHCEFSSKAIIVFIAASIGAGIALGASVFVSTQPARTSAVASTSARAAPSARTRPRPGPP